MSSDPLTGGGAQHQTEAEPDVQANGRTIVATFQVGRFAAGGGAMAAGWATSTDAGGTWKHGIVPALTTSSTPAGPYAREVDNSVAYDAAHGVWLVSSLGINPRARGGFNNDALVVNRSNDGVSWSVPTIVSTALQPDKDWLVCDNTPTSSGYGTCYAAFSQINSRVRLAVSRSTDGGQTWSTPTFTANQSSGYNVQIVVQPDGTAVIVATQSGNLIASRSTDRGQTWSAPVVAAQIQFHDVGSKIAVQGAKPTVRTDNQGTIYAVWSDCRFRASCGSDDLVMTTSGDGVTWSPVSRIPLDPTSPLVDHYLPGLGVDPNTGGSSAHLALVYYFNDSACGAPCGSVRAAFVTSSDGGRTWKSPALVTPSLTTWWLPTEGGDRFLGDYTSTAYVGGKPMTVIPIPRVPHGSTFDDAMYAIPLVATPSRLVASVGPGTTVSLNAQTGLAGSYVIVVHDRTRSAGFHLRGAGINKSTRRAFVGTVAWHVTLQPGRYRFYSDARNGRSGTLVIQ